MSDLENEIFKLALMTTHEREELTRIAKMLPANATIVEIGTFMGGSAAILAAAKPDARVHSFDLFDDDHDTYRGTFQYELFDRILGSGSTRTLANVSQILKDFNNITLYKARSPDNIGWTIPVDLYFEDSLHFNPTLDRNLNFWSPYVKCGGYVVLHDYRPWLHKNHEYRYPDVEKAFKRFKSENYTVISITVSLVVLRKNF